jgi:heme O synthase-like polyprenyltransferase
MQRTCQRPLPAGRISVREALVLGLVLSVAGAGWAFALSTFYGTVVFAGLFIDVVI